MTSMDLDTASEFAKDHHRAVMTTNRLDGTPQMSPILVGIDTERRLLISTRTTAMKVTNLERDPRAYLCVMSDEFYGPWVQLSGTTEIIRLPGAMDLLISYYRDLSGEHPDWDEYRAVMVSDRRVLMAMTVDRVYGEKIR